jgi:hypothetical protein
MLKGRMKRKGRNRDRKSIEGQWKRQRKKETLQLINFKVGPPQ